MAKTLKLIESVMNESFEDFKTFADRIVSQYINDKKNNGKLKLLNVKELYEYIFDEYLPKDIGLGYQEAKDYHKIPYEYEDYLKPIFDKLYDAEENNTLSEDTIFGAKTQEEKDALADAKSKGLHEDVEEEVTVEDEVDDIQDETPTEDEEDNNTLDNQLQDLRDILPDLDLSLYQVTSKEDPNKNFYFIGKVSDDDNKVLMLVDNNPTDEEDEASKIEDELPNEDEAVDEANKDIIDEPENDSDNNSDESEEGRFDFALTPYKYDDFVTLNPRYGDELNPDHEAIMEYLMKCLIEKDPDKAKELQDKEDDIDTLDATLEDEEDEINV